MANNVKLIDPHEVNIKNNDNVNGIPQYQDMFIYAELFATSRGRTVIITSNGGAKSQGVKKTGFENNITVNLMGVDQNSDNDNPNYLKFSTNYYDGSTSTNTQFESFGITSIKVGINSSFVPQINIQFVDIRGLSFFNQENSPYRILFNFPPPIFELTIKGYYGKALKYKLHLVKYTSEFQADSGNFIIDANFIAITYAPLTDILFRYVINASLIADGNSPTSLSPFKEGKPQNTYELILKLQNLYSEIQDKVKNSEETTNSDNTKKIINKNNTTLTGLYSKNFEAELGGFKNYYYYKKSKDENNSNISYLEQIKLIQYDEIIKGVQTEGIPSEMDVKLYIMMVKSDNQNQTDLQKKALSTLKNRLINGYNDSGNERINDSDITNPEITTANNKTYIGIDITNYYLKIKKSNIALNKKIDELNRKIITNVNNVISEKLGMQPTIYNIFKIICDDVDRFFVKMYKVAENSEKHHETNKSIILGNNYYNDVLNKIFAFPLIVNKSEPVCGGIREERIAPIELSKQCPEPFPEIKFIDNFIKTFFLQAEFEYQNNLRSETNEDGSNVWLPLSPIDSKIIGSNATPYLGKTNYLDMLETAINRFYIISQYAIPERFYNEDALKEPNKSYIKLYAESEAVNLISSISGLGSTTTYGSDLTSSQLKKLSDAYKTNIGLFFDFISKNLSGSYNFEGESVIIDNNTAAYVDKIDSKFKGFNFINNTVEEQNPDLTNENKPIAKFMQNTAIKRDHWWKTKLESNFYKFTTENIIYIRDMSGDGDGNKKYDTRYLEKSYKYLSFFNSIDTIKNGGNTTLQIDNSGEIQYYKPTPGILKKVTSINDVWVNYLNLYDDYLYEKIIHVGGDQYNRLLSEIVLFSSFGTALSPFDLYSKNLNEYIFNIPSIVEIPTFLGLYIGALIAIKRSTSNLNVLYDYFQNGNGKNIMGQGKRIIADISDCDKYLSEEDKNTFYNYFYAYDIDGFDSFINSVNELYETAHDKNQDYNGKYNNLLDPDKEVSETYRKTITDILIERINVAIYTQLTFLISDETSPTLYTSLNSMKLTSKQLVNNYYFEQFFTKIANEIFDNKKEAEKKEEEKNKKADDKDIITQTYYSFKNINDKWVNIPEKTVITNGNNGGNYGYPFNQQGKSLIDSFVFVDRAMNPIGDTMLNAEILTQVFDDPNITVFTVISQLLSTNGFEFFPIQNFMINDSDWEDSFKIDMSGVVKDRAAFVCMYIGGTSSYPTGNGNDFNDDGITDLSNTNANDFNTSKDGCIPAPDLDNQNENNKDFPYHEVRAFSVRFGQQNQSMFTNIKIDSKEYPETNESIQILSRLAGDNKNDAPIPKGQNLYSLFENRSYKATIEGLGNAMIQPTQYFQLENVPLFNGAYIILNVEHIVVPNKMTTSFSGTKILRYPVPRVKDAAAFMGFDGSSYSSTSPGSLVAGVGAITMSQERLTQLNSVYGIDVSHWQSDLDWNKVVTNNNPDFPTPEFAIIKATQGTKYIDTKAITNATGAKAAGLKIGYYHYAEQFISNNTNEIITNSREQATFFINTIKNNLPEPNFPLILDIEDDIANNKLWSKVKTNNDLWINTFLNELKNAKYNAIIYSGRPWLNEHTSSNFSSYPLWHAQYPKEPEFTNPTIANGWKDWTAWQFSPNGSVNGINGRVDINAMKKSFFDSHTT
jgi:lysozyme